MWNILHVSRDDTGYEKKIQGPVASKTFLWLGLYHIPSLQSAKNNDSLEVGDW